MLSDDPSHPGGGCEEEAAMLLCQLYSVSQFSSTVEEILLEEFAAKVCSLTVYTHAYSTSFLIVSIMLSSFYSIVAVWNIMST